MKANKLKKLVSAAFAFCAAALYAELPNPVAWWKMDAVENGKVPDASGNGRDLTLGAGTSLVDGGLTGKALSFDGSQGAFASFSCPALQSRTISMWTRLDPADGPAPAGVFSNRYFFDGISTFNYALYRGSERGNNEATIGETVYPLGSRWALGEWVHMVWIVSYNSSTKEVGVSLYENGSFRAYNRKVTASSIESATTAILGNTLEKNKAYFGLIDEVKIYDVDFDAAKVIAEYKSSAPEPSLLNHWKMDSATQSADGKLIVQDETGRKPLILSGCSLVDDAVSGKAAQFTGLDGCNAAASNAVTLSEFTLMAWVKMSSAGTANPPYLFRSVGGSNKPCQLYWTYDDFKAYVELAGRDSTGDAFSAGIKARDRWCHVALVASVGNNAVTGNAYAQASLYVDGEKVGTGAERGLTSAAGLEQQAWMILGNSTGSNPFLGLMDDVRIYRGALSAARIREVFVGCATVDAGADFTVRRETARLMGERSVSGMTAFQPVPGEVAWTLVSAPVGGESAEIRAPNCLTTDVMLPVQGTYTFRLSVSGAESDTGNYDDVIVTRLAPTENMPPTVTVVASSSSVTQPAPLTLTATVMDADDDAVRLEWSKVSGPGGVWFEPQNAAVTKAVFSTAGTYVLACTADDGLATAAEEVTVTVSGTDTVSSLTECLWGYWPFDGVDHDVISQTRYTMQSADNSVSGRVGNGICASSYDVYVGTQRECPGVDKLTFSWWMYDDKESALLKQYGANYTRLLYPCMAEPQYYDDILIVPVYDSAGNSWEFTFGGMKNGPYGSLANRWAHCALVFDLSPYNDYGWPKRLVRLYVDGKEIEMSGFKGGVKDAAGKWNFVRKAKPTGNIAFVGRGWGLSGGQLRGFYGKMDEVRCYTNALNEAQIQRLALDASVVNRAPVAEVVGDQVRRCSNRQSLPIVGAAYDDGLPTPEATTLSWSLPSGNPMGVGLPMSASGQIRFTKAGTYSVQIKATDGENVSYSDPVVYTVDPLGLLLLLK